QFGIGFQIAAERDPQKKYNSGAYDNVRDGAPDQVGWVADLMKVGAANPGTMLCPSNDLKGLEKLNDLVGTTVSSQVGSETSTSSTVVNRQQSYIKSAYFSNFSVVSGDATPVTIYTPSGTPATSAQRIAATAKFIEDGGNTNYVQSWFACRGSMKLQ